MDEYLNKTQKELDSLLKFKFKFKIRFSDILKLFKNDTKGKAKRIRKKHI